MTAQPMMATMMTSAATTAIIWFWDMCLPHTVAFQLRPSIGKGKALAGGRFGEAAGSLPLRSATYLFTNSSADSGHQ
jgi:hypothetical protein